MSDRAATGAAVLAGSQAGLPVLAWTLPAAVAARLDPCVRISKDRQRR